MHFDLYAVNMTIIIDTCIYLNALKQVVNLSSLLFIKGEGFSSILLFKSHNALIGSETH